MSNNKRNYTDHNIDGNKIIHEFMGCESNSIKKYDKNWGSLMKVVDRISSMNLNHNGSIFSVDVTIGYGWCSIRDEYEQGYIEIYEEGLDGKTKYAVWLSVISFILNLDKITT